jgi:hypothetical protein
MQTRFALTEQPIKAFSGLNRSRCIRLRTAALLTGSGSNRYATRRRVDPFGVTFALSVAKTLLAPDVAETPCWLDQAAFTGA